MELHEIPWWVNKAYNAQKREEKRMELGIPVTDSTEYLDDEENKAEMIVLGVIAIMALIVGFLVIEVWENAQMTHLLLNL